MELVDCNFCGSDNWRVKYCVQADKYHPEYLETSSIIGPAPPDEFTVVSCSSCGLHYLNPRYDADELLAGYPEEQYTNRVGCFSGSILFRRSGGIPDVQYRGEKIDSRTNWERLIDIRRFCTSGRLLDVGCNNGSFIALLEREGWETYGVDFSQTAIDNAQSVFGQARTFCGQLVEAGYADDFFDVVTLYDTIEHLPNPKQVLEEIERICKPTALVIIQTIDFGSVFGRLLPRSLIFPAQHLYYFRAGDLSGIMNRLGFSCVVSRCKSNGVLRYIFYLAMHSWVLAMVALHRSERGNWMEMCRRFLEKCGVIYCETEMLRRMKMVGAGNIPALCTNRTFFFSKDVVPPKQEDKVEGAGSMVFSR